MVGIANEPGGDMDALQSAAKRLQSDLGLSRVVALERAYDSLNEASKGIRVARMYGRPGLADQLATPAKTKERAALDAKVHEIMLRDGISRMKALERAADEQSDLVTPLRG